MIQDNNAADWTHPMELIEPDDEAAGEIDVADIGQIPIDALRIFASFLIPKVGGPARWRAATVRLAVLAHSLRVDDIGGMSLTKIAEEIGVSRSLPSLLQCELRDFAKLDCRGGKTLTARETYSKRAKAAWDRRKGGVGEVSTAATEGQQRRTSKQTAACHG